MDQLYKTVKANLPAVFIPPVKVKSHLQMVNHSPVVVVVKVAVATAEDMVAKTEPEKKEEKNVHKI